MAKLSLINRDEKRRGLVKKYAKKRAMLVAIMNNTKMSDEDRMAARLKVQAAAAQRESDEAAQPLRDHRPPARLFPQVRSRAQQAARIRDARRGTGHRQGKLVIYGTEG